MQFCSTSCLISIVFLVSMFYRLMTMNKDLYDQGFTSTLSHDQMNKYPCDKPTRGAGIQFVDLDEDEYELLKPLDFNLKSVIDYSEFLLVVARKILVSNLDLS